MPRGMYLVKCFYCGFSMYVKKHPYLSYRSCPVCGRNIRLKGSGKRRRRKRKAKRGNK